jgi:hypothetical protein
VVAEIVPDDQPIEQAPADDPPAVVEDAGPAVTPEEIRDEACDPATDVPRLRDLYRIAHHHYRSVTLENECGDEEGLTEMLERLAAERKAEAA